jgi:hypothetical protein
MKKANGMSNTQKMVASVESKQAMKGAGARGGKRPLAKTLPKHDEQDEDEHDTDKSNVPMKGAIKGKGASAKSKKTDEDELKETGD